MYCNKCGENNLEGAKFCRSCGASLSPNQNEETSTQKSTKLNISGLLHNKKLIVGAGSALLAVVVLVIAISVIGSLTKPDLYITTDNYITSAYSPDTEKTMLFVNGTLISSQINGKAYKASSSTDGKTAAYISEDNALYIVEKDSIQKMADDIEKAVLSYDGNVMAYVNQDNTLYTIQLSNRKIEKIADDVVEYEHWLTFSPDGNTLLFMTEEDDEYVSYIKTDSKKTKLEKFLGLFTINNGKMIYGLGEDEESLEVYDLNAGSSIKLSNDCDDLLINNNHQELLFVYDSKYYLSINGEERIKIGNYSSLKPILPDNASSMGSSYVSAAHSFIGTLMQFCKDGVYGIGYIDEHYEMNEVIKNTEYINVSDDYSTIYYIRNESLYMAKKDANFEPEKIISDVKYYDVSSDGKKIYYVNSDDELMCHYKNEDKRIAEDVYGYSMSMTDNGTLFFLTDYSDYSGTLYRCSDGKNKVRVADDIYYVSVYPQYVQYYTESDSNNDSVRDIFISTNEKDFKKIAGDVKISY